MKNFLSKVPMPLVGVTLGCAVLGNLIQSYGNIYRNIMGLIALVLFSIMTAKFICHFEGFKKELDHPVAASVFATYPMSIMVLATYIKPYQGQVATVLWLMGVIMHVILIIMFSRKYLRKFNMKQVFPSWFIVYVGIATAAVTGKMFNQTIGQIAFWFALIAYVVLIFVIGKRVLKVKEIPEPVLPTLIIFAAPGSLCLAGYINSFNTHRFILVVGLVIISQCFYIGALIKLIQLLRLKFYPSYAAFTFPLVISALGLKLSNGFFMNQGVNLPVLGVLVKLEEVLAVIIVFYVLIRYIRHIVCMKNN